MFVFFAPNCLGHPDNYIPANPLATPAHIVPEWYFWPFYAILAPSRWTSFCANCGACWRCSARSLLFFLPWLDKSPVRSRALSAGVQALLLDAGDRRARAGYVGGRRRKRSGSRSARWRRHIISRTSSSSCRCSAGSSGRCRCRRSRRRCCTAAEHCLDPLRAGAGTVIYQSIAKRMEVSVLGAIGKNKAIRPAPSNGVVPEFPCCRTPSRCSAR